MYNTLYALKKIKRVLETHELTIGRSRVEQLVSNNYMDVFSFNTRLTDQSCASRELVVVPRLNIGPEDSRWADLLSKLAGKPSFDRVYVIEVGQDMDRLVLPGHPLEVISTDRFHDLIVQLPREKKFNELLLDEGETRNRKQLGLYQTRSAVLRHEPTGACSDGRGQSVELPISLDDHLSSWAHSQNPSPPILLLGERGSGKTWQLLRFCQEQNRRHQLNKWAYGPAFLIKLRTFRKFLMEANRCLPMLAEYLLQQYTDLSFHQDFAMMSALQSTGHLVLCLDGLDEMDLQASDIQVQEALSNIVNALPVNAKFIISCRGAHFRSLEELLALRALPETPVSNIFQILYLQSFDQAKQESYLKMVKQLNPSAFRENANQVFGSGRDPLEAAIQQAMRIAGKHPFLLDYLVKSLGQTEETKPSQLAILRGMIENGLIQANLQEERTSPEFISGDGQTEEVVAIGKSERLSICQEIAWMLAERGHEQLDFHRISDKIRFFHKITNDALERDIRSQTVFQLPELLGEEQKHLTTTPWETNSRTVLFTLRFEAFEKQVGRVSEASVTGAYFTARFLAERLLEQGPMGPLGLDHGFRYLGRVPLGSAAGAMLAAMLLEQGLDAERLRQSAFDFLRHLLKKSRYALFTPWCRHLLVNLCDMGCVTTKEVDTLDPWSEDIKDLLAPPSKLPDYNMVLIPGKQPFLLGVHEVTNKYFLSFIEAEFKNWAVEVMTKAASGKEIPPSDFHGYSNEYHLYFWEKHADAGKFMPTKENRDHPVTWVSWFAAAAFCNWLSDGDGRTSRYRTEFGQGQEDPKKHERRTRASYRLPFSKEWKTAAMGGHDDLVYPWDMFPYHLEKEQRERCRTAYLDRRYNDVADVEALKRYVRRQLVMQRLLVQASRKIRPVMYDDFNDFGISGLIGNVKEWCEDEIRVGIKKDELQAEDSKGETAKAANGSDERRLLLGASAYLDESSFRFDYQSDLYPQNTNPDVGFRVARSLAPGEIVELDKRLDAIADALGAEPSRKKMN